MTTPPTPPVDPEVLAEITLIDAPTLARLWGVTEDWITDQTQKGGLPHVKLGLRTVRFYVPDLKEHLKRKTQVRGKRAEPADESDTGRP
ncbi:helix-turn-helix transcriptional regulator [Microbispora bryophytorum]|uniref:helix-turn-helix transcriptional regulator n=1 Tax=Microbispora bryophytorum TaxID=1460882 RepID=UPI0033FE7AAA